MGICIINNTLQWVEQDALSIEDFGCIYGALVEIKEVKPMMGEQWEGPRICRMKCKTETGNWQHDDVLGP